MYFSVSVKAKGWASPEWPPCLPSSPPWITLAAAQRSSSRLPLFRRPRHAVHFMHSVCWPGCTAFLVCLFFGSTRVTHPIWEEETWKELLSWSQSCPSSQLPRWLFYRICLRLSCFCGEVFIIPLLFKTLGARGVQQLGVCTRAAPAKLPIQIHPGVPREADPTLGSCAGPSSIFSHLSF